MDYVLVEFVLKILIVVVDGEVIMGVYVNDGWIWDLLVWYGLWVSLEIYVWVALIWYEVGVRIIGGCCGMMLVHICVL